ncbi:copper amine oxidase N-terminal domain-containing protein [Kurthia sp. Dielmo]|uniref:copper amine oxidase N-terminal domain-containing protein n=1 Tax=Kurthia sp. Dielmo TaxID=1033738 RepID=UPI001122C0F6|nr:copper amine oxidase N-terminal domain-containing protein [Kurthia sp. Dielmo]
MSKRFDSITKIIISTTLVSSAALGVANITFTEQVSAKKTNDYKYISTKINGKKVALKAKSVKKDGIYFVHSTELLNKLGVKSSFNSTTKTLKVTNGNKTITIKKGSKYAYEGKKKYTLPATLQNINGRLYVPHDIISKVTNYKTKVTSGTLTITKKVSLGGVTNNDNAFNSVVEHKNNPSVSKKIYNVNASNKTLGNSYGEKDVASYKKLVKHLEPFAEQALAHSKKNYGDDSKEMKAFDDYYNKGVDYNKGELSREERIDPYIESILNVKSVVGVLKKQNVSSKLAEKIYKDHLTVGYFSYAVQRYASDNYYDIGKINNSNDSLYGFLHGKGGNCRTDTQLLMYMHNKLGNETAGLANDSFTHVSLLYKVEVKWIKLGLGNELSVHTLKGNEIYNLDAHY